MTSVDGFRVFQCSQGFKFWNILKEMSGNENILNGRLYVLHSVDCRSNRHTIGHVCLLFASVCVEA